MTVSMSLNATVNLETTTMITNSTISVLPSISMQPLSISIQPPTSVSMNSSSQSLLSTSVPSDDTFSKK